MYPKLFKLVSLVLIAVVVAVKLIIVAKALVAVVIIEVVITVKVRVEAGALGCKYFLLVSSTSLTISPVTFIFTP
jgi:hypothetical protein